MWKKVLKTYNIDQTKVSAITALVSAINFLYKNYFCGENIQYRSEKSLLGSDFFVNWTSETFVITNKIC